MKKSALVLLISALLLITAATVGCTSNVTPAPNASPSPSLPSALQLEGTTWILKSLANETGMNDALPNTTVSAKFSDGNVTGSSGCNFYAGTYQLNKTGIKIESLMSTLMYCEDPTGVMSQESSYLMLLQNVTSYAVNNNKLKLLDRLGNAQLVFETAFNEITVTAAI